jgi:hypothetical protein
MLVQPGVTQFSAPSVLRWFLADLNEHDPRWAEYEEIWS